MQAADDLGAMVDTAAHRGIIFRRSVRFSGVCLFFSVCKDISPCLIFDKLVQGSGGFLTGLALSSPHLMGFH